MNTKNLIRSTVRAILEHAHDYEWSLQGLGMLRTYLSPEVRLHVWHPPFMVPNVSTVHDHPWDFRSYIVSGMIHQYRFIPLTEAPAKHGELLTADKYMMQHIRCGPGGCAVESPSLQYLVRGHCEEYIQGEWYEQIAEEIHESLPEVGTVTLVERHFRSDTEHARVYYQTLEWVSAEPRTATREEVAEAIGTALSKW